jgi:hypothetical protein
MATAQFGAFGPARFSAPGEANGKWDASLAADRALRQEERDAAILAGKLPQHEQEHDRRDELSLASWLALMNF